MNDPMIGRTVGKYRIIEHLGRGGMAEVYKAYQPNLDRYVAVKMMHTFLSDEKEFLARFQREAKVVATLRGWVLLQYGSGPINGFAVMLLVGIFTTIITNTWITSIFFDWYIARKKGQMATISI